MNMLRDDELLGTPTGERMKRIEVYLIVLIALLVVNNVLTVLL